MQEIIVVAGANGSAILIVIFATNGGLINNDSAFLDVATGKKSAYVIHNADAFSTFTKSFTQP